MQADGQIKAEASFNPIPSESEVALVTSALMVDEMAVSVFDNPAAQRYQPDESNAHPEHQTLDAQGSAQMGGFQVKAMTFHVSVHLFNPHSFAIDMDDGCSVSVVGNQDPWFVFALGPVDD